MLTFTKHKGGRIQVGRNNPVTTKSVTTNLFGVGDRRVLDQAAERASSPFTGMYAATEDGFWALRQRLIEEKEPGDISVMIAPGDRIPRIRLIEELLRLEAIGVELVSTHSQGHPLEIALGPQDSASPSERGKTIRESMARKALRGVVLGRIPYGYKSGDHGQLDEHPDEATVVKVIFGLAAQGKGIRAITTELNSRGLRTRRGGAWSIVTIRDMLRNRVYTGAYNRFGARVAGNHTALVAPALFREIQDRLDERGQASRLWRGEAIPAIQRRDVRRVRQPHGGGDASTIVDAQRRFVILECLSLLPVRGGDEPGPLLLSHTTFARAGYGGVGAYGAGRNRIAH